MREGRPANLSRREVGVATLIVFAAFCICLFGMLLTAKQQLDWRASLSGCVKAVPIWHERIKLREGRFLG